MIRCKELNIQTEVVHNASILTAVGCCGLQLYRFGEIVSIPLWSETWKPTSYLDKIIENLKRGLHTLCLLGMLKNSIKLNCLKDNLIFCFKNFFKNKTRHKGWREIYRSNDER